MEMKRRDETHLASSRLLRVLIKASVTAIALGGKICDRLEVPARHCRHDVEGGLAEFTSWAQ
jgi:hypothetical protein